MTKEDPEPAGVVVALRQWIGTAMEPRLKPLRRQSLELSETALRAVSSFRRRCDVYSRRSEQDMAGLADHRRLRAAAALNRICKATASDCEDFFASVKGTPLSKLDSCLTRLCERVSANYNESGRLIVGIYGSENSLLRMEIESLQQVKNQVSSFQSRNREIMKARALIEELVTSLAEHRASINLLNASRIQIENEIHEQNQGIRFVEQAISDVEAKPEIASLDTNQKELKRLRQELLNQKMSRLRGPLSRFLSLSRGAEKVPETVAILSRYMRAPLTSLARETDGYLKLKQVLLALQEAIETGQVNLNKKKTVKTLERIRLILDGSLLSLQKDAKQAFEARNGLLRSQTAKQLQSRRLQLRLEHNRLADSRKLLEAKITRILEETSTKHTQLATCLGRMETLVSRNFGKTIPSDLKDGILLQGTQ